MGRVGNWARGKAYGVYVMQFPPFPGQPDLNYVIHQLTPFVALILMFMGVRWVLRSPVGEALAERIRHRSPGRWAVAGEDPQRVAALEEQVSHLQAQVGELAERLDFAERMLAERRARKLGAGRCSRWSRDAASSPSKRCCGTTSTRRARYSCTRRGASIVRRPRSSSCRCAS